MKIINILESLQRNPIFKSEVITEKMIYPISYRILQQGRKYNSLYIILKGSVDILVVKNVSDDVFIHPGIANRGPGDIFGELALFDEEPANANVIAASEVELIAIEIGSFRKFLKLHPKAGYDFLLSMYQILADRLRHADNSIVKLYGWGIKAHNIDQHLI